MAKFDKNQPLIEDRIYDMPNPMLGRYGNVLSLIEAIMHRNISGGLEVELFIEGESAKLTRFIIKDDRLILVGDRS